MKDHNLETYAINENESLGRIYSYSSGIEINDNESIYAKDSRRILHSESFNRLRDKTQVFPVTDEKTNSLSRMAHSMQVAQLSADIANVLHLNPEISYTLGLLHDIGHAPFGHLGQDVLNELMKDFGGFEHNFQALRIVDKLERNNPSYEGLNLTFEVREGLLKHCSEKNALNLEKETQLLNKAMGINLPNIAQRHLDGKQSFLESQLVDLCDSISYLHSDLKDAFKNDILTVDQMKLAPGFQRAYQFFVQKNPTLSEIPTQKEKDQAIQLGQKSKVSNINDYIVNIVNIMYKLAIQDLISNTRELLHSSGVKTVEDVKNHKSHLVGFTNEQYKIHRELKDYSRKNIYRHPRIHDARFEQKDILVGLFNAYMNEPEIMIGKGLRDGVSLARNVADNISGMTDKFAMYTYNNLKENRPELIVGQYSLPETFEISPDKKVEKKRLGIK